MIRQRLARPLQRPVLMLTLCLCVAGAQHAAAAQPGDEPGESEAATVLATVGDRQITRGQLQAALDRLPRRERHLRNTAAGPEIVLRQLIQSQLIELDAERGGLLEDPDVLARLRRARESVLMSAMSARQKPRPQYTDADLRNYYEAHKRDFVREVPTYRTRHILALAPRDAPPEEDARARAVIDKAQQRIAAGEPFRDVALDLTEDPAGPELGYYEVGTLDKAYESAALALEPDGIAGPVRTDFGWHLLQLVDIRPPVNISFEEARKDIRKFMAPSKKTTVRRSGSRRQYLNGLREKYAVTIDQEAIKAMSPEMPGH